MSIFGMQPAWLDKVWAPKRLWHTHVQHAVVVFVLFAGNGASLAWILKKVWLLTIVLGMAGGLDFLVATGLWLTATLAFLDPWMGFQIGALAGLAFYLLREIEAHRFHWRRYKEGALAPAELRLAWWDSRLDFIVPLAFTLPVVGHDWGIWSAVGALWAVVITHYLFQPKGYVDGLR